MAQYDVTHIDIGQYRELRRLVQDGRAKAAIVVEYENANAPPVIVECLMDKTNNPFYDFTEFGSEADRV